jgi:hypothetical protein
MFIFFHDDGVHTYTHTHKSCDWYIWIWMKDCLKFVFLSVRNYFNLFLYLWWDLGYIPKITPPFFSPLYQIQNKQHQPKTMYSNKKFLHPPVGGFWIYR